MMQIQRTMLALLVSLCCSFAPAAARSQTVDGPGATDGSEEPIDIEELRDVRKKRGSKYPIGSRISRYLAAAAEVADEGDPAGAIELLDKLNPRRLNPNERAYVRRLEAHIAYGDGDFAAAIEYFEQVLEEEVLPLDAENKIRFNIAQIHVSLEQWSEVIAALDRWFRYVEEPEPLAYYLRAIALYSLDEIDPAIESIETAIDLRPDPKEGWLQLATALYVQKEDYANAAPLLEELVVRFPKKQYWVQLALIYGARDNYRESLAVQQVAYLQGFLTEDKEVRRLARSYLYHDLPHPAAEALQKGLDDGVIEPDADFFELLANSWIAAREYARSLPALREAAQMSEDGDLYVRLGQVHLQSEEWSEATRYLKLGLEKGSLSNPGNARLLLGIAYYNDEHIERARSAFVRASQYDSTRARAQGWISHLEREAQAS